MTIIIGYGNFFRGDDGVGIKIVEKLGNMNLPEHVKIINGGIRDIDVLMNIGEFEKLIIIDSIISGGEEGALYQMTSSTLPEYKNTCLSTHGPSWTSFLKSKIKSNNKDHWSKVIFYGIEIKNTLMGTALSKKISNKIPDYINTILKELQ